MSNPKYIDDDREIECANCGSIEPMPGEFRHLKQRDLDFLCEGYMCEKCWSMDGDEQYSRQGMAEMNGSGYGETI